jgi:hypothetical protein
MGKLWVRKVAGLLKQGGEFGMRVGDLILRSAIGKNPCEGFSGLNIGEDPLTY